MFCKTFCRVCEQSEDKARTQRGRGSILVLEEIASLAVAPMLGALQLFPNKAFHPLPNSAPKALTVDSPKLLPQRHSRWALLNFTPEAFTVEEMGMVGEDADMAFADVAKAWELA
ncbi:hypothetical protein Taro_021422 [Colocasia esculenta]|uniref:Uncharacterized protein n=1 Tax=Colocasia esculenta TaxID=4460 RepID=A0A843URD6_COLES|nr:hypothetical protein [Colocasia esculenta]